MYIELSVDEAIKLLQKSKYKKVLVAISDLEKDDIQAFHPILKEKCIDIIYQSKTLAKCCGDMVDTLNAFSERQNLRKIKRRGNLTTILIHKN